MRPSLNVFDHESEKPVYAARKSLNCTVYSIVLAWMLLASNVSPAGGPQSGAGTFIFVPAAGSLATGKTLQLTAYRAFAPSAGKNTNAVAITDHIQWFSSDPNVAMITNGGLVTAVNVGTVTITAVSGPFHAATQLAVTPVTLVSLTVTAANVSVPKGRTQQFAATGTYSDNSTGDITNSVIWSSSASNIAPVNNRGLASGATVGGPITITAQDPSTAVSGTAPLTVSAAVLVLITVSTGNTAIVPGESRGLNAIGTFSDNSTADFTSSVNWSSSNTAVATIGTNTGIATGQALAGPVTITAIDPVTSISGTAQLNVQYSVVTYHNDIARTGQNIHETQLTLATVNKTHFGRRFSQPVDGYIYAQPLYVPGRIIPGKGRHNVVYVVTEHDSVYAFDADDNVGIDASPLWKTSLIPAGGSSVSSGGDAGCGDLIPEIGITSTPVIDPVAGTMYVVSKTKESGKFFQRLHALDITTGAEKPGSPVTIQASVSGTGDGSVGGMVSFNPLREHQRSGLLLQNGMVYIGWASHCDSGPYHGWVMAYNASTLAQVAVFNTSPNSGLSGIWMGGGGLGGDGTNVFFATGNGFFDAAGGGKDYGDSIMSLGVPSGGTFPVATYFTPFDQANLNGGDTDVGSGGVLLLPTQTGAHPHLLVQVGKQGVVYLVDRDTMGGFCAACTNGDTQIVQELRGAVGGTWGMSAYWNNFVYFGGSGDRVKAYSFNPGTGLLSTTPTSRTSVGIGTFGPTPSVSANGNTGGILWVIQADQYSSSGPATLRAFDATNLAATELYDSNMNAGDGPGVGVKFTVPTIANGKVYVGTASQLSVYGLH
jgi:hypothetical protein